MGEGWWIARSRDVLQRKGNEMKDAHRVAHLDGDQRDTLSRILQDPVGRNLDWRLVLSLLDAVAVVVQPRPREYHVTLGDETEVFRPPPGRFVHAQMIVDLRRVLRADGYGAEGDAVDNDPRRNGVC